MPAGIGAEASIAKFLLACWAGAVASAGLSAWGLIGLGLLWLASAGGIAATFAGLALAFVSSCLTVFLLYGLVRIAERLVIRRHKPSLAIGAFIGAEAGVASSLVARNALIVRNDAGLYPPESYRLMYAVVLVCALAGIWIQARLSDLQEGD